MPSTSGAQFLLKPDEVVARSTRGAAVTTLAGLLGRAAGLLTTVLVTPFVSKGDYGRANLALIIATLAYVVVTIGGALLGAGAMSLPLGMVARHLCRTVALGWWCRTPLLPPRLGLLSADARRLLREVAQYSWPIHLGGLCAFITMYLDN